MEKRKADEVVTTPDDVSTIVERKKETVHPDNLPPAAAEVLAAISSNKLTVHPSRLPCQIAEIKISVSNIQRQMSLIRSRLSSRWTIGYNWIICWW